MEKVINCVGIKMTPLKCWKIWLRIEWFES